MRNGVDLFDLLFIKTVALGALGVSPLARNRLRVFFPSSLRRRFVSTCERWERC